MKKVLLVLVVTLLCVCGLFATNYQKIYDIDTPVYEAIKYLFINQGHALPSTTAPYSGSELRAMLEKLDRAKLDEAMVELYDYVESQLSPRTNVKTDVIDLDFSATVNLEMYYHTNINGAEIETKVSGLTEKAFQGRNNWIYGTTDQRPFLRLSLETFPMDNFYSYFELAAQNARTSKPSFGSSAFSTNVLFFQNMNMNLGLIDGSYPWRGFVAAGSEHWSLQVGRDKLSFGAGETGNMVLSRSIPYHDMVRFTTFSDKFKYTFLTSFFFHPINYYRSSVVSPFQEYDTIHGLAMYIAHRMEGRFFNDKLSLALTESLVYMAEDNTIDFRALNPVNFMHNNYTQENSNSALALEFDWTVVRGINLYGQAILDEFAFPGIEGKASPTSEDFPDAMGFLVGVQTAIPLKKGVLHASLEGAKTTAFLYLRYAHFMSSTNYGLQYVMPIREWSTTMGRVVYDEYFIGYKYGPDAIVANFNIGYDFGTKLSIDANVFYMLHGTHDIWTIWQRIGGTEESFKDGVTPTASHANVGNRKYDQSTKNAVEKTLVAGVNVKYNITKSLSAFVQADFINKINYANRNGLNQSDTQLAFGASLTF